MHYWDFWLMVVWTSKKLLFNCFFGWTDVIKKYLNGVQSLHNVKKYQDISMHSGKTPIIKGNYTYYQGAATTITNANKGYSSSSKGSSKTSKNRLSVISERNISIK